MKTAEMIGCVISVLGVLPFFGGGILNITKSPVARRNIDHVGYPSGFVVYFGVSVITLGILTLIPATSFLGAILATAWMGGAIAAHVRIRDKPSVTLGIMVIPICIWVGFGLRHLPEMHSLLRL